MDDDLIPLHSNFLGRVSAEGPAADGGSTPFIHECQSVTGGRKDFLAAAAAREGRASSDPWAGQD